MAWLKALAARSAGYDRVAETRAEPMARFSLAGRGDL